jgi:hypothetical protein
MIRRMTAVGTPRFQLKLFGLACRLEGIDRARPVVGN